MTEETNSSSIPVGMTIKQPNIYRIGLYTKLTILINGLLIVISLMVGWALWLTIARAAIDNYIKWFNNPHQPNANLPISFNQISITVFIILGIILALVVVPFIFLKTKNGVSAFFGLISFIISAIFVIFFIIFFIFRCNTFTFLANKKDHHPTNTTTNFIIVFLPWMLSALFAVLLLIHSLWLMINITYKYKSNALIMPVTKPAKHETIIIKQETDDTITLPNVVTLNEQPPIAAATNNTTLQQAPPQETIINNPQTETVHYTNYELSQVPTQGAYRAEAVPPTPNTLTNLQPAKTISNEEQIKEQNTSLVSSQPIAETDIAADNTTNYQPKNQGGFDVKDNIEPEVVTSNGNEEPTMPMPTVDAQQLMPATTIVEEVKPPLPEAPEPIVTTHHWTLEQIEAVWEKAEIIDGVSDKLYRKDYGGAWMFRDAFTTDYAAADNAETYSWTIVLHRPASKQGTTDLYNLDPMNIVNAKSKGENYPSWKTKISSKGNKNIAKEQNWKART